MNTTTQRISLNFLQVHHHGKNGFFEPFPAEYSRTTTPSDGQIAFAARSFFSGHQY